MKYTYIAVGAIVLALVLLFVFKDKEQPQTMTQDQNENEPIDSSQATAQTLLVEDTQVGTGEEAIAGKTITVHYTGTFQDGTKFDSSLDRGEPFSLVLGEGRVIAGWEQGLLGMKVGGKRKLTIPPSLAYGENGIPGAIPPNSTLIFQVELLAVE